MGIVKAIYLRPERGTDPVPVETAQAVVGTGLEGDHCKGGSRQITILAKEAWEEVCKDLGVELDPKARRANLFVEGVDLKDSVGTVFSIGQVGIAAPTLLAQRYWVDEFAHEFQMENKE